MPQIDGAPHIKIEHNGNVMVWCNVRGIFVDGNTTEWRWVPLAEAIAFHMKNFRRN